MRFSGYNKMKVFCGNANRKLAVEICDELGIELGNCDVKHFSDGEINVNINETVRGIDVFLIQSTCSPVNDNLMEILILCDAMKRASVGRLNVVIPYDGYARQDRKTKAREPITAKLIADLLQTAGADRVISMDLHAGQIQGYFNIPVDHLSGIPTLVDYFRPLATADTVVVSPDLGGVTRARNFANLLDLPLAIVDKRRPKKNVSEVKNVIGEIAGKDVFLVDDIIDTAGSITNAATVLKERGANRIYGCATHGVFSGPAIERIANSNLEKFITTDTIPLDKEKRIQKIGVTSIAPIFAEAIRRIHENESVSRLFD